MFTTSQQDFKVRIYYEDTDSGGIVYHSKYLNFAERGRTEFLRKRNLEQNEIRKEYELIFVVKALNIKYLGAAYLDDIIVVKTEISQLNKAKVIFEQAIIKEKIILAKIKATVVCINKNRKICRMNDKIYDILKK